MSRRLPFARPFVRRRPPEADLAQVASTVHSLAVLLSAGVDPVVAWGYLRHAGIPESVAARVAAGNAVPESILHVVTDNPGLVPAEAEAWRGLAAAWAVASEAGAPLAPTLRSLAVSLRELAQAQREIRVALAAPAATARMVMFLPVVGILFGAVLGFNTLSTLTTTPLGWVCLVIGTVLLVVARRWNRHLIRGAQPRQLTPGLEYDLTAIAVSGGAALERARTAVATAIHEFHLPDDTGEGVDAVLDLSRRAGVPAAELLLGEADEVRRAARTEVAEKAASLSVTLLLPLGVCVLPAFMAVGVLPLVITIVTSSVVNL